MSKTKTFFFISTQGDTQVVIQCSGNEYLHFKNWTSALSLLSLQLDKILKVDAMKLLKYSYSGKILIRFHIEGNIGSKLQISHRTWRSHIIAILRTQLFTSRSSGAALGSSRETPSLALCLQPPTKTLEFIFLLQLILYCIYQGSPKMVSQGGTYTWPRVCQSLTLERYQLPLRHYKRLIFISILEQASWKVEHSHFWGVH